MIKNMILFKNTTSRILLGAMAAAFLLFAPIAFPEGADDLLGGGTAHAQTSGNVPGNTLGNVSDPEYWRGIRKGLRGTVSIPDKKAGVLVQSEGDNWRAQRNGPVSTYGAWGLAAIIVLLLAFFMIRGRIRIDSGASGRFILRFNVLERTGHWLTAVSFIILGLTGLNILYGKYVLLPVIGKPAFAAITQVGKYTHNYVGFAFMLGLLLTIILWLRNNLPDRYDLNWILKGGGLFVKGTHPPAGKFNFGQKIVFWSVTAGGIVLSYTGINLLFPFELADLQGMQLLQIIHVVAALVLTILIIAHIYIGTIGMEGAAEAMTNGYVDMNWAKEHHSAWVEEVEAAGVEIRD